MSVLFDNDMKLGKVWSTVCQSWLQSSWRPFKVYIRDGSEQGTWFQEGLKDLLRLK